MMRWYCTGTSMACVARCFPASASQAPASNLAISTARPPQARVGKKLTSVVFEYSGVATMDTTSGP